jgi:hypothetical protein
MRPNTAVSSQSGCLPSLSFAVGALMFTGVLFDASVLTEHTDRVIALIVTIGIGSLGVLVRVAARARALERMPSAEDLLQSDTRLPVLYLRSFQTDSDTHRESAVETLSMVNLDTALARAVGVRPSFEQNLAFQASQVGPFVALGSPSLGAARFTSVAPTWKEHVKRYIGQCQVIIVRVGESRGLKWELGQVHQRGLLPRLVLYLQFAGPQDRGVIEARYREFTRWFAPRMGVEFPAAMKGNTFMTFRDGRGRLAHTLTEAMRDLGVQVEPSWLRATLKAMLPGASNRFRRPWSALSRLPVVIRWPLFILSVFVSLTLTNTLCALLAHLVSWAALVVLVLAGCCLSGGVIVGRLSSAFNVAGGVSHFLLGCCAAGWSYLCFVLVSFGSLNIGVFAIIFAASDTAPFTLAIPFAVIAPASVVYGLSANERTLREALRDKN